MKLRILPDNDSVKVLYTNHGTYHEGDSGLDLYFPVDVRVEGCSTAVIELGIRCEALDDEGEKYLSYWLAPRSSISRTPLRMANSIGIIDAGYRGVLKVAVDNRSEEMYMIKRGDRLFQICAPDLTDIKMSVVSELSTTSRGEGGFGSTGPA
jgi:dUTP pyrophosphatase